MRLFTGKATYTPFCSYIKRFASYAPTNSKAFITEENKRENRPRFLGCEYSLQSWYYRILILQQVNWPSLIWKKVEYGNWEKLSTKHNDVISSVHACTLNCDTTVLLITKILNWIQNTSQSPSSCWYHSLEVKINVLNADDYVCLL